jgi:glycine cleavage system H protein
MSIPETLFYSKDHEWVRFEQGDDAVVGISDHAQEALGDITFVDLPKVGRKVTAGDACAVVESVKAASDVYAPLAGEVTEVNTNLTKSPEKVNSDPYGEGWLYHLSGCDRNATEKLMTAAQYRDYLASI